MPRTFSKPTRFKSTIAGSRRGRVYIPLTFDPVPIWGARSRYHVAGTINGKQFRGAIEQSGAKYVLPIGPSCWRGWGLKPGDGVDATLSIEGPGREDLAPDIAAALNAEPEASAFFDSLAGFYVQNYLRWIDATKRSPETRVVRIERFVEFMKAGIKQGV